MCMVSVLLIRPLAIFTYVSLFSLEQLLFLVNLWNTSKEDAHDSNQNVWYLCESVS